jgi:hypothetical protein
MVDEQLVKAWLADIAERVRAKTVEVDRLRSEISAELRRKAALMALLAADKEPPNDLPGIELPGIENDSVKKTDKTRKQSETTRTEPLLASEGDRLHRPTIHPIERGVLAILEERGKPVHISDLRAELVHRNIPIPGKGSDSNVIVYLSRSPNVCRVGRGMYALRTWGVPEVPARRRRSGRRKIRAHSQATR